MKSRIFEFNIDFLITIFLLVVVSIVAFCLVFKGVNGQAYSTMKYDLIVIENVANSYAFLENVADGEIITFERLKNEKYYNSIIDPFDNSGVCNEKNSYMIKRNGYIYVTFNCNKYWIFDYKVNSNERINIYKVDGVQRLLAKSFK